MRSRSGFAALVLLVFGWNSASAAPQGEMGAGEAPPPASSPQPAVHAAPAPRGAAAAAKEESQGGIQSSGLWSTVGLGYSFSTSSSFGAVTVGYKMGKLAIGAVFSLGYRHDDDGTTTDTLGFALGPRVEYILATFGSVGFYAGGQAVFGLTYTKSETAGVSADSKGYAFGVEGGVGGRYYFGGRIGLGMELGLTLDYTKNGQADSWNIGFGPYALSTMAFIW